jgi:HD-like signal output (HDOD) protein
LNKRLPFAAAMPRSALETSVRSGAADNEVRQMPMTHHTDGVSMPSPTLTLPFLRLTQPLADMNAWVACFHDAEIPVMAETAEALEAMREHEDDVDANLIGEMISGDPLMTLKVMAFAAKNRPKRLLTEPETVTSTLVMMGISPFFRAFGPQPVLDDVLQDRPEALVGLNEVLRRANRAANFALSFAVHRLDPDASVIHQAALLHDFAELLLWCHAPDLSLSIRNAQRADPSLRSKAVQQSMLHVELTELQHALMQDWRLPELLVRITDDKQAHHLNVQCVMLGVRLARHTALGWDNAALPDDVSDVARLLNLSNEATLSLLRGLDV